MSDITVRKMENKPSPVVEHDWDPFRWARSMLRWDPFRGGLAPMMWPEGTTSFMPAFEVKETKEGFLFKGDVPGVKEGDIDITLTGNRLSINGKREAEKEEKTDTYYSCERSYGSFTRTFTLPEGIDPAKVHAELKSGVLTVFVPHGAHTQPKKITVKT